MATDPGAITMTVAGTLLQVAAATSTNPAYVRAAYLRIASIGIGVYEYVLTVPAEYRFYRAQLRRGRMSQQCLLFILIRYTSVAVIVASNAGFFGHFSTLEACRRFVLLSPTLKAIQTIVSQFILFARAYTIARRARWVFWTMTVLLAMIMPLEFVANIDKREPVQDPSTLNCTSANGNSRIAWAHYAGAMVADAAAVTIATWYLWEYRASIKLPPRNRSDERQRERERQRARDRARNREQARRRSGEEEQGRDDETETECVTTGNNGGGGGGYEDGPVARFVRTLLYEGLGYFAALTLINIANLLLYLKGSPETQSSGASLGYVVIFIMSQRILIRWRETAAAYSAANTAFGATTIQHGPHGSEVLDSSRAINDALRSLRSAATRTRSRRVPVPMPVSVALGERGMGRFRRESEPDREWTRNRGGSGRPSGDGSGDVDDESDPERARTPNKSGGEDSVFGALAYDELEYYSADREREREYRGPDGLGGYVGVDAAREDLLVDVEASYAFEASLGLGGGRVFSREKRNSGSGVARTTGTGMGTDAGTGVGPRPRLRLTTNATTGTTGPPPTSGRHGAVGDSDGDPMRVRVEKARSVTAVPRSSVAPRPGSVGAGMGDAYPMSNLSSPSALHPGAGAGTRAGASSPPSPARSDTGSLFFPSPFPYQYPYTSPPTVAAPSTVSGLSAGAGAKTLQRDNSIGSSKSAKTAVVGRRSSRQQGQTESGGSVVSAGLASVPELGERDEARGKKGRALFLTTTTS